MSVVLCYKNNVSELYVACWIFKPFRRENITFVNVMLIERLGSIVYGVNDSN